MWRKEQLVILEFLYKNKMDPFAYNPEDQAELHGPSWASLLQQSVVKASASLFWSI